MIPVCPHYKAPQLYHDYHHDKAYEGLAMCNLVDKYCVAEHGQECEEYNNIIKEEK